MVFAISLSSVSTEPFSNKVIRLEFDPLTAEIWFYCFQEGFVVHYILDA